MATVEYTLWVLMEDGTTFDEVKADQRDVASWEMQPFGTSGLEAMSRVHLFMRYVAWHALKRRKETKLTWEQFNDACVESVDRKADDDDEEADAASDAVDPGRTAPTDDR